MGKVFTWADLEAKKVPKLENFSAVLEHLRTVITGESSIRSAVACGSVVRGDHNRRSDIDCVVIIDSEAMRAAFSVLQVLSEFSHDLYVPLSFIVSDSEMVKTCMHHFGPSFIEHVSMSMDKGGLIKGNPLGGIAESVTRQQGVEEYLRFKLHYLQAHWAEYLTMGEEARGDFLKKTLEAPLHVARKVLSWQSLLRGDSKAFVRGEYMRRVPKILHHELEFFGELDSRYSREIESQLEELNPVRYCEILNAIEEQVPRVIEFVTDNLLYIDQKARV